MVESDGLMPRAVYVYRLRISPRFKLLVSFTVLPDKVRLLAESADGLDAVDRLAQAAVDWRAADGLDTLQLAAGGDVEALHGDVDEQDGGQSLGVAHTVESAQTARNVSASTSGTSYARPQHVMRECTKTRVQDVAGALGRVGV